MEALDPVPKRTGGRERTLTGFDRTGKIHRKVQLEGWCLGVKAFGILQRLVSEIFRFNLLS